MQGACLREKVAIESKTNLTVQRLDDKETSLL
jgi:hypothetical protein